MAERTAEDVKLRPMPGDVMEKKTRRYSRSPRRCVTRIIGNALNWLTPDGLSGNNVLLTSWRKWAATAEVIHIAQPAGTAGEEA